MDGAGELQGDPKILFHCIRNTKLCANCVSPARKIFEVDKMDHNVQLRTTIGHITYRPIRRNTDKPYKS